MKVHHCIDVCCGGRMFYFDKHNPDVVFMDNREFTDTLLLFVTVERLKSNLMLWPISGISLLKMIRLI